ncbi:MAG: DUF1326 domain-containing protein [Acidobacteria bacterium]|nr:DUF1326 domain-containing protein [Acidobacteriota bacterium]
MRTHRFYIKAYALAVVIFLAGSSLLAPRAAPPEDEGLTVSAAPPSWQIEGALTEACTCAVPCTCNFGEGPSPHNYCYALYSYEIRKGRYGETPLDGLHFGGADLAHGRTLFIDERANDQQRAALRVILARIIERASAEEGEDEAARLAKEMRYVGIKQEYDDRRNRLEVAGIGQFNANYIMGLDKTQPLVVRNNTTWRIRESIKAKTTLYRVKVGKDKLDVKGTNSNQGDYAYTDQMDFGTAARWSCGASMSNQGEVMCGGK